MYFLATKGGHSMSCQGKTWSTLWQNGHNSGQTWQDALVYGFIFVGDNTIQVDDPKLSVKLQVPFLLNRARGDTGSPTVLAMIYPDLEDGAKKCHHLTCYGCGYLVLFLQNVKLNKTSVFTGASGASHEPRYQSVVLFFLQIVRNSN